MNHMVAALRRLLGTDTLSRLETFMASTASQLDSLNAKITDVISDVRANTVILQNQAGSLDAEGQAALDRINATVDNFDAEVGDADGSDTTAPIDTDPFDDSARR